MAKEIMLFENIQLGEGGTIKSVDLVGIINTFREVEGKKGLRHDNFMARIEEEIEALESAGINSLLNFKESNYTNSRGKEYRCYELDDEGMMTMLVKESSVVRFKTVQYVKQLKEENVSLKESNDNLKQIATSDESVDKRTLKVKYNDLFRNTMIKKSFKNCKVTELKEFYADFIEFSEAVGIKPQDMKVKYKHIINQLESMLTPLALAEGTISGGEYIYVHELVGKVKDDKNENDNRINGGKKSAQTKENKKLKAENKALNDKLQRYIDMYGDMD